jgi:hypothetical protein
VTSHAFDTDWPLWAMHPNGDEIVCLPKGTWHTAKARAASHMLFITAGEGTQHRDAR